MKKILALSCFMLGSCASIVGGDAARCFNIITADPELRIEGVPGLVRLEADGRGAFPAAIGRDGDWWAPIEWTQGPGDSISVYIDGGFWGATSRFKIGRASCRERV